MINKFPKKINKKWNRFDKIEKIFIIYLFILTICFLFVPVLKQIDFTTNSIKETYSLFNKNFIILDIFIIIFLTTLLFRNTSFRFRKLIYILIGFKENEGLLNLGILSSLLLILITI